MNNRLSKAKLYDIIHKHYFELMNDGHSFPFSIGAVCSSKPKYVYRTEHLTTPGLRGVAVAGTHNIIIVNSALSPVEQNFHGFHEYCHTVLHRHLSATFRCFNTAQQNNIIEWQANEGAAELLAPSFKFIPEFVKLYNTLAAPHSWIRQYGNQNIYLMLAVKFKISPMVVQYRIESLAHEIDLYIATRNPFVNEHFSRTELQSMSIETTDYNKEISLRMQAVAAQQCEISRRRFLA